MIVLNEWSYKYKWKKITVLDINHICSPDTWIAIHGKYFTSDFKKFNLRSTLLLVSWLPSNKNLKYTVYWIKKSAGHPQFGSVYNITLYTMHKTARKITIQISILCYSAHSAPNRLDIHWSGGNEYLWSIQAFRFCFSASFRSSTWINLSNTSVRVSFLSAGTPWFPGRSRKDPWNNVLDCIWFYCGTCSVEVQETYRQRCGLWYRIREKSLAQIQKMKPEPGVEKGEEWIDIRSQALSFVKHFPQHFYYIGQNASGKVSRFRKPSMSKMVNWDKAVFDKWTRRLCIQCAWKYENFAKIDCERENHNYSYFRREQNQIGCWTSRGIRNQERQKVKAINWSFRAHFESSCKRRTLCWRNSVYLLIEQA